MKKLLFITATLFSVFALGQSTDQNYIKNTTYKVPTTVTPNPTDAQKTQNVTYFDGLGRPIQQIAKAQSATAKDGHEPEFGKASLIWRNSRRKQLGL